MKKAAFIYMFQKIVAVPTMFVLGSFYLKLTAIESY